MPEHQHPQEHGDDHPTYDRAWWDQRYGEHDSVWSQDPNPQLVAEAAGLAPGRALDVGCGEGSDAIWLARQGWRVTGVDHSQVGLDRAAARAAAAGAEIAGRISWQRDDLLDWTPPDQAYDLVSSQFMHLPHDQMHQLVQGLASSVAPGGILLVVGHDFSDIATGLRPNRPEMFYTADGLADRLPDDWTIEVAASRRRTAPGPAGELVEVTDAVLRARRSGSVDGRREVAE